MGAAAHETEVAEVKGVGHAAEKGDGEGEPAVDEEAHAAMVYGECVEEEGVDEEPETAYQQEYSVPILHPRLQRPTPEQPPVQVRALVAVVEAF